MIKHLIICTSYGLSLAYQLYELVGRDYVFQGLFLSEECAYECIRYTKKLTHSEFVEYITNYTHIMHVRIKEEV